MNYDHLSATQSCDLEAYMERTQKRINYKLSIAYRLELKYRK